jgi:penicillin-binding protein 2
MRHRFLSTFMMICLLVACDALPNPTNPESQSVEIQQAGLNPQEVVETFLTAWASEDFATMHSLLSPRSVEIYSFEDFQAQYANAHGDIGFSGVSFTIDDVQEQGTSAAITYDVLLDTSVFGEIPDEGRTMRLVRDGDTWQIAWSPMDIINGMTANVNLDPNRDFEARGNIYDRNGHYLVQETGSSVGLIMRLSDMRGETECTELLSRVTLRPISYFNALYVDYRAFDTAFFVGEINLEIYNRYANDLQTFCATDLEIDLVGSKVPVRSGRSYFGNGAAAHITGYTGYIPSDSGGQIWRDRGYDDRDIVGLAGVEYTYQDILAGTPDQSLRLIDSSGVILRTLGSAEGTSPSPIQLTIDRELQWATAQAFIEGWNYAAGNWVTRATGGAAVVMDVNTGAVLSMFSFPTYDPRIFNPTSGYYETATTFSSAGQQISMATSNYPYLPLGPAIINRAYTEQYAPGSVFKIISTLAAGDSGIWQRDELFDCQLLWENGAEYGDTQPVREDWRLTDEYEPAGEITMAEALTTSCNPFFWEIGALMYRQGSPNMLHDYAMQFGMGERTGLIGLSAEREASGNIPEPAGVDVALNNVIGQGDTQVTALQMARLVSAVANGGTLYRPYLVQQIGGIDGAPLIERIQPEAIGDLGISQEALDIAREGMCGAPSNERLGTSYSIFDGSRVRPSYTSCGKTGTAQTTIAPNAWYVAYAPADNPVIAVVVIVPNSRHGSEVSAPIVRRIMDVYFGGEIAPFPSWWNENEYVPVEPPQGIN